MRPRNSRSRRNSRRNSHRKSRRQNRKLRYRSTEPLRLTYKSVLTYDAMGIPWYIPPSVPQNETTVEQIQLEIQRYANENNDLHVLINKVGDYNVFNMRFLEQINKTHNVRLEQPSAEMDYKHVVISKKIVDGHAWDSQVPPFSSQTGGAHIALFTDDGHAVLIFQKEREGRHVKISNGPGGATERREGFIKTIIAEAEQEIGLELNEFMIHHATLLKVDHSAKKQQQPYGVNGIALPNGKKLERKDSVDTYVTLRLELPRSMADRMMQRFVKEPPAELDTVAIGLYKLPNISEETKIGSLFKDDLPLTALAIRPTNGHEGPVLQDVTLRKTSNGLILVDREQQPVKGYDDTTYVNFVQVKKAVVVAKVYPSDHRPYVSIEDNTLDDFDYKRKLKT